MTTQRERIERDRRERLVGNLFTYLGLLMGACAVVAIAWMCWHLMNEPSIEERMEESLGSGAVCGREHDLTATCVRDGKRYVCASRGVDVACAEVLR